MIFIIKLLKTLTNILNNIADILLYIVLFLVSWQFLWSVLALGLWQNIGEHVLDLVLGWPIWSRMLIGLPLLIIVFVPMFLIIYWLYDEPKILLKIVEIRQNAKLKDFLEFLRKTIYLLAVFSVLKTIWLEYDIFEGSLNKWLELLRKVFVVLVS